MRRVLTIFALAAVTGCSASVQLKSASSVPPAAPERVASTDEAPPPEVIVHNIEFDSARAQIRDDSRRVLDDVAALLIADPTIQRVDVDGHTDARGTPERNLHLSVYRANAVRTYLIDRGVAAQRLVARGLGDERPISDNRTVEGRQLNRRVEFTIYRRSRQVAQTSFQ